MVKAYIDDKVIIGDGHLGIVTGVYYDPVNKERKIKVRFIFNSSYTAFNSKFVIVKENELNVIEEQEVYTQE